MIVDWWLEYLFEVLARACLTRLSNFNHSPCPRSNGLAKSPPQEASLLAADTHGILDLDFGQSRSAGDIDGQANIGNYLHPDKVMFPVAAYTKQQVCDFYAAVAPWILPHLKNRPLTL